MLFDVMRNAAYTGTIVHLAVMCSYDSYAPSPDARSPDARSPDAPSPDTPSPDAPRCTAD